MPKEYKILGGIALGAVILGIILFKFGGSPASYAPLTQRADAYSKGSESAQIIVSEFADFQCPACRQAQDISNQLLLAYPNEVQVVFRHFPLPGHTYAMLAAEASEAAGDQGKFWEMHDLLYEKQTEWSGQQSSEEAVTAQFIGYAQSLGLNIEQFSKALDSKAHLEIINQDMSAGRAAGVGATPTFFVNDTMISSPTFEAIKQEIERQK